MKVIEEKYFHLFLLLTAVFLLVFYTTRLDFEVNLALILVSVFSLIRLLKFSLSSWWLIIVGLLMRLCTFGSLPSWSDDFYRFLWDGNRMNDEKSVFSETPNQFAQENDLDEYQLELLQGMNSPDYFTIYPPLNQLFFKWADELSDGNIYKGVFWLRLFVFLGEIGVLVLLLSLKVKHWFLYWLNPLVVMEIGANLHMEGWMLFGLLLLLVGSKKESFSLIVAGMLIAINAKLLPLMLLPALWRLYGWRKGTYLITVITSLVISTWLFVIDLTTIAHLGSSLSLYFQKFEFNASLFYLIRWLGFKVVDYDIIQTAGPVLGIFTFCSVIFLTFRLDKSRKDYLAKVYVIGISIYFLCSSIVHPWYILSLLGLGLVLQWRYTFVWTFSAFLSYTAYVYDGEISWVLFLSYSIVVIAILMEFKVLSNPVYAIGSRSEG